ncbi:MAG: NADH-quinone oxidoreductase subunit M [Chloroflexota bacterium]|nr:NADH-quinone oxidoreductase subunit M [Chloroflexota bacterium]
MESFPLLSLIAFLPALGAVGILFAPKASPSLPRQIALGAALISFVLSLVMLGAFDRNASFQFTERLEWLPDLGISYFLGVDGIAVLLIVLTTLLSAIAIVWSWDTVKVRQREYYIAMLLLETGMIGVFMALDLFVFYIFWELMLIPMALLIGVWGSSNRVYAAIKFFLYTLFGSLLMLVGIVATYQAYYNQTGERTLDILRLQEGVALGAYSSTFQFWVFAAFFIAFAVKVPMFPFHTWLPDAHVEAPTAASVILAAVMLKMGGYGLLRFNLPLFPEGTADWTPVIITLSIIGIIYGALVALVQPDMKKLVAYSSVSHMGFVTLGIFIGNLQGMDGAMLVMLAHGFNTGGLFLCIGVIYERAHTRNISAFGGIASRMPAWAAYFMIFMFASIGLPGLSGFVGEFLVALGTWDYNPWAALITFAVVIFAAWYMMWMFQRVVFGRAWGQAPDIGDTQLLPSERAELAALGGGHNEDAEHGTYDTHGQGGLNPRPVSGGDHGHDDHHAEDTGGYPTHEGQLDSSGWADLSRKEALTLFPLAALTIIFGVYPKPLLVIVEPSFQAILEGAQRVVGN